MDSENSVCCEAQLKNARKETVVLLNKWTLHKRAAAAIMALDILALDGRAVEAGTPPSRSSLLSDT